MWFLHISLIYPLSCNIILRFFLKPIYYIWKTVIEKIMMAALIQAPPVYCVEPMRLMLNFAFINIDVYLRRIVLDPVFNLSQIL